MGSCWQRGRPCCGHADPREGEGRQGSQPRSGVFLGEGARTRGAAGCPEHQQPLKATRFGLQQRAGSWHRAAPQESRQHPKVLVGVPLDVREAGGSGTGSTVGSPGDPSPLRVPRWIFHELHPAPCAEPQPLAGFCCWEQLTLVLSGEFLALGSKGRSRNGPCGTIEGGT